MKYIDITYISVIHILFAYCGLRYFHGSCGGLLVGDIFIQGIVFLFSATVFLFHYFFLVKSMYAKQANIIKVLFACVVLS